MVQATVEEQQRRAGLVQIGGKGGARRRGEVVLGNTVELGTTSTALMASGFPLGQIRLATAWVHGRDALKWLGTTAMSMGCFSLLSFFVSGLGLF